MIDHEELVRRQKEGKEKARIQREQEAIERRDRIEAEAARVIAGQKIRAEGIVKIDDDTPVEAVVAPVEEVKETPLKKATTPWKPARVLDIPDHLKDPRFTYRFVNSKKEGNEMKKQQEGWEYDHKLARQLVELYGGGPRTLNDGTPLDSTYKVREMVVMRMPKEMATSRNKYYTDRANKAFTDYRKQLHENIIKEGGEPHVYGKVEEEKTFVRRT